VPVELGRLAALAVATVAGAWGPHAILLDALAVAGAIGLGAWLLLATRAPAPAAELGAAPGS
jgi:hypothetical protein